LNFGLAPLIAALLASGEGLVLLLELMLGLHLGCLMAILFGVAAKTEEAEGPFLEDAAAWLQGSKGYCLLGLVNVLLLLLELRLRLHLGRFIALLFGIAAKTEAGLCPMTSSLTLTLR
jgi:hypothetical protein